ncbi:MAG: response regulator [Oscillospiraceae bacterium]|nr:response regulator [Oscillospiraceae bacterium]
MWLEQVLNLYAITINVVGLVICLFRYVRRPRKDWVYAIAFLLGNLLSNYYWGAYTLMMGEDPNVSSFFAYFGWDISYVALLLHLLALRKKEKGFFSPLCLIPIPLNIAQFILYIQFGGILNNIWQSVMCTSVAVLSINSLVYYRKNKADGAQKPYIPAVMLLFIFCEYTMWTSSCFDWPSAAQHPYYYFCIIAFAMPLLLAWAISRTYRDETPKGRSERSLGRSLLPPFYILLVFVCCFGGYFLAVWTRNKIAAGLAGAEGADPYSIIAVMLFVFSAVLVLFSIAIILVVGFGQKARESEKLRQDKLIAEHSNAAKTDFLTSMSHEIRTPINAVLGMNEMILREALEARDLLPKERDAIRAVFSKICGYSGNIESAGNNLLSIINDILDFSKIESGKMELVEAPYKLSSMLNDVSNMIAFKARDKGLEFYADVDETIPDGLCGDELRVRQIVTNLLGNAVKYTNTGSIRLSVRKAEMDRERLVLRISVKDSGIGIKPEDMDKLFVKFARVDLPHNSTVEGTGLGLAITWNLLEMMGGSIRVESVYGEGSEFIVTLPQKIESLEPVGDFREKFEKSMEETKAYRESFHAPEAHILVVDDTRMNLLVVANLLNKTEIEIDTVTSGAEALSLAETIPYDLILMDQRMPEMDGTEAMNRIKEQPQGANRETPFICLTADAVVGARERYLALGFTDYLTKPINSQALEKMLMRYLPAEKISRQRETPENETPESKNTGLEALNGAGIDSSEGLRYCQDDESFYRSVLQEFVSNEKDKREKLCACFDAKDWHDYAIYAHSLKSTARMIGADELSLLAQTQETAALNEAESEILAGHAAMMEAYASTTEAIRAVCPTEQAGSIEDGDEVLEFSPDTL